MNKENLVPAIDFCRVHEIEFQFICSLYDNGLIEIITIDDERYIHESQVKDIEKIMRLYYDLNINLEGIETIINLLNRIDNLRYEIVRLRNNLSLYETNESG